MKKIIGLAAFAVLSTAWADYIPEPMPVPTKDGIEVTAVYYPGTDWMAEWDMVDQVYPHIKISRGEPYHK